MDVAEDEEETYSDEIEEFFAENPLPQPPSIEQLAQQLTAEEEEKTASFEKQRLAWKEEDEISDQGEVIQDCSYLTCTELPGSFVVQYTGGDQETVTLDKAVMDKRLFPAMRRIGPVQREAIWFKMRKPFLTGSAIYKIQKGGAQMRDYMNKKMGVPQAPMGSYGRMCCDHGTYWEPFALRAYEAITGNDVLPLDFGLVTHPTIPYFAASPDGVVGRAKLSSGEYGAVLLEIKCPYKRYFDETTGVPTMYMSQLQLLMDVLDIDEAHFWEWKPANCPFNEMQYNLCVVPRDRTYFHNSILLPCRRFMLQWRLNKNDPHWVPEMPRRRPRKKQKAATLVSVRDEFACMPTVYSGSISSIVRLDI